MHAFWPNLSRQTRRLCVVACLEREICRNPATSIMKARYRISLFWVVCNYLLAYLLECGILHGININVQQRCLRHFRGLLFLLRLIEPPR